MNKVLLIAQREIGERFRNRSFKWLLILGPLIVLGLTYLFLNATSVTKKEWKVLMMDKNELFDYKLTSSENNHFEFDFINAFVDYDEFADLDQFQDYDLAVWINEKVVTNKKVIISYRERPSEAIQHELVYLVERRLEEIMVDEFSSMSVEKFREIKQKLSFSLKDTYDPKNEHSTTDGWVGFAFGAVIILFVFMFGMSILRSVAREKSNRIVEVLLSSVKARQLLSGKVLGIGFSALVQFTVWVAVIGVGLFLFRETLFPNLLGSDFVAEQLQNKDISNQYLSQSPFVDLIYNQIQYINMILFFTLFFIGGYLFYGSFFAMVGASMGSESDGQQFIIPITLLLVASLVAGYYQVYFPGTLLGDWLSFIPFTSPMVMMVELSTGFGEGDAWVLFASLFVLFISAFLMLAVAGRIYKNGILHFNHRLKLGLFFKWLKK